MADEHKRVIFEAVDRVTGVVGKIASGLGTIGKVAGAVAAVGIAAVTGAVVGSLKATSDWAGQLDDLGDVLGTNAEQSAALAVAITGVGGNVEQVGKQLVYMQRGLVDSKGALGPVGKELENLGINVKEFKDLDAASQFAAVADKIAMMPDGLEKSEQMTRIFGNSAKGLTDTMNALANGGLQNATDKARALGLVVGDELVEKQVEIGKAMAQFDLIGKGLAVTLGSKILPALLPFAEQGVKLAMDVMPTLIKGVELFGLGLQGMFDVISGSSGGLNEDFWRSTLYIVAGPEVAEKIIALRDAFADLWPKVKQLATDGFQYAADMWTNTLQPALTAIGDWLWNVGIPAVIQFGTDMYNMASDAFGAISDWWTNTGSPALTEFSDWLNNTGIPAATEFGAGVALAAETAYTALSDWWTNTGSPAALGFSDWATNTALPAIQGLGDWIGSTFNPVIDATSEAIGTVTGRGADWAASMGGDLQTSLTDVWTFITESLAPTLGTLATTYIDGLKMSIETWAGIWTDVLLPAIVGVHQFITENVQPALDAMHEFFFAVGYKAVEAFAGLWENILAPALEEVWKWMDQYVSPALAWLKENLGFTETAMGSLVTGPLASLKPALQFVKDVLGTITGLFRTWTQAVKDFELPEALRRKSPAPIEIMLRNVRDYLHDIGNELLPEFKELEMLAQTADNIVAAAEAIQVIVANSDSLAATGRASGAGIFGAEGAAQAAADLIAEGAFGDTIGVGGLGGGVLGPGGVIPSQLLDRPPEAPRVSTPAELDQHERGSGRLTVNVAVGNEQLTSVTTRAMATTMIDTARRYAVDAVN